MTPDLVDKGQGPCLAAIVGAVDAGIGAGADGEDECFFGGEGLDVAELQGGVGGGEGGEMSVQVVPLSVVLRTVPDVPEMKAVVGERADRPRNCWVEFVGRRVQGGVRAREGVF